MICPVSRTTFTSKTGEKYVFTKPVHITTDSTWERLTDTAVVKLPRLLDWRGMPIASGTKSILERGMKVDIEMGFGTLEPEFTGYVSAVQIDDILEIKCEDAMWPLKQRLFKVAYPKKVYIKLPLKTLLTDLLKGTGVVWKSNVDVNDLGNWEITGKPNIVQVLDHLQKHYHLYSFFRDGVLWIGAPYETGGEKEIILPNNQFVSAGSKLEYVKKEDRRVRLVVYAADRKDLECVGKGSDDDGDQVRVPTFLTDRASIQALADRKVKEYKWEGLSGTFKMVGMPRVRHGDTVGLIHRNYPDRNGKYRVKRVVTDFSSSGFFRNVTPHHRVS